MFLKVSEITSRCALLGALMAQLSAQDQLAADDAAQDALQDRIVEVADQLMATPAHDVTDRRVKASALFEYLREVDGDPSRIVASLVVDTMLS